MSRPVAPPRASRQGGGDHRRGVTASRGGARARARRTGGGGRRLGGARPRARRARARGVGCWLLWNLSIEGQPLPTYIKEGVRNLLGQPMGRNKETGVLQELGLPLLLSSPPLLPSHPRGPWGGAPPPLARAAAPMWASWPTCQVGPLPNFIFIIYLIE